MRKNAGRVETSALVSRAFHKSLIERLAWSGRHVLDGREPEFEDIRSRSDLRDEYRGLADLWEMQIKDWTSFRSDFEEHASSFYRSAKLDTRCFNRLQFNLCDPHDGGRCVIRACLPSGEDWFYKPRNGRREAAWSELLRTLNATGFKPSFLVPMVFAKRDHCWMVDYSPRPCHSREERECFSIRIGVFLYLAHVVRAVDLHRDNLLAHGEQPVLVDCETLFHPDTAVPSAASIDETSICRTGMFSRIGNGNLHSLGNCPRAKVLEAFESMHRFWNRHRREPRLRSAVRKLRGRKSRYVFRPTMLYRDLLDQSLTPERLRNSRVRSHFLRSRLDDGLSSPAVVSQEVAQLMRGDIPIFHGPPARVRILTDMQFAMAMSELRALK